MVKNPLASAGDTRDASSRPELRRSPGEENNNPLQYSCLGNPTDRGAWGQSPWGRGVGPDLAIEQQTKQA